MQTREQQRAQKAFECINLIKKTKSEEIQKKYGSLCLYFPAFVHSCGLCQSVAFYEAKAANHGLKHVNKEDENYYQDFLNDIFKVATDDGEWARVRTMEAREYQDLTREIMAVANWFKRYAEALLKVELGSSNGDNSNGSNSMGNDNSPQEGK